jgi:glycosyltransferase involved in cell wall biosynthesis
MEGLLVSGPLTEMRSRAATPALSVLMAIHNDAPEYLVASIGSILAQTFEPFELLLLDDGSTRRDTIETLHRFAASDPRIRLFHEPHRGLTRTLNVGLSYCRADLVCRHDADDWSKPDRFRRQVDYLSAHPEVAVVGSAVELCQSDGRLLWSVPQPQQPDEILAAFKKCNPFCHGAVCFRAAAARQIGGYCEDFQCSQDYDFFWRLCEKFGGANLPDALYCHRRNGSSISSRKIVEQARARYAAQYLADQRARGESQRPADAMRAAAAAIPDDASLALIGRADQLLLSGHYTAALRGYLMAIVRAPYSPKAYMKALRWVPFVFAPASRARLFGH